MLNMPLITFVVTSFNYAGFIEQTLESIKQQSYKNFEIIVVDDASSDNSVEIIERFIQFNQELRITLIRNDKNIGQFASMMKGLKIAEGQFISFADSDDILLEEYASAHLRVHLANSVALTSAKIVEIDGFGNIHTVNSPSSPGFDYKPPFENLDDFLKVNINEIVSHKLKNKRFGGWYWSPNSTGMFRTSAILPLLNFKDTENWRICPDKLMFNFAHLVGGSVLIETPLVAYRRHGANAGGSDCVSGDVRYNNNSTTIKNIKNNLNIKPDTIKFFIYNRKELIEKFGIRGYLKLFVGILL